MGIVLAIIVFCIIDAKIDITGAIKDAIHGAKKKSRNEEE